MDEILNDHAVKVKVILIGNSTVGKTAFLYRYVDDHFITAFVPTLGIDFKVKTTKFKERRVKVQAWDSAGQERFRTITTTYYRNAMGFILMYDITNEESFLAVRDWMTEVHNHGKENAQVTLIGNKCDLSSKRVISYARGKQLADELDIDFFETSAKMNVNVVDVFQKLIYRIFTVAGEEAIYVPLTLGDLRNKNSANGMSNGFNAGPHEKDVCAC